MFDLDNFDLEFDDDFSTNIFNKALTSSGENEQCKKVCEDTKENRPEKEKCETVSLKRRSSIQYDKPNKRLSHEGLLHRKFPGPAGLLPDKPFKEIGEVVLVDKQCSEDEEEKDKQIYSQMSGSVFLEMPYQKLRSEFGLNEGENRLSKYTVEWVKKTALNKGLHGRKIPFLAVVLHCVNHSMPDPVLLLRDPTGEINGSLHRDVWAELGGKLHSGIAIALRQVGVLITGVIRRQIYLNITKNNILSIYRESEDSEVEVTPIVKLSRAELLKSLEEQPLRGRPTPTDRPSPSLFTTVNSIPQGEEIRNLRNKLKDFVEESKRDGGGRKTEEVLADLGIVLSDGDFAEDTGVPPRDSAPAGGPSHRTPSQEETAIVEEVLSGINFDEFEM